MNRLGTLLAIGWLASAPSIAAGVNLDDPAQLIEAYVRANGDTAGGERVTYATSVVYAFVPGEKARPLFSLEIVGVSRFERIDGGYARLHREVAYYTDLKTGAVLERWRNPYVARDVQVMPIRNDPVNRRFVVDPKTGASGIRYMADRDWVILYRDVPLRYPNVLTRAEYPLYSHGDFYEAMELFNTMVKRSDLENTRLTSVPSAGSWTRIGPWLPWMEMGNSQGWLVYHGRSVKLDSVDALPARLRAYVAEHDPTYLHAPEKYEENSETSWTMFKREIDARRDGPAK